jgi:hypothetical protein
MDTMINMMSKLINKKILLIFMFINDIRDISFITIYL